jgi:Flp pilus assembly protein TadG
MTKLQNDAGQSLLEIAICLPVFVLLTLGAAEFGRLAYIYIEVTNAANAGVEYGSQNHATAGDYAGMAAVAQNDGSNIAGLTATATNPSLCTCSTDATQTLAACSTFTLSCVAPSRTIEYVQVTTTATVNSLFGSYFTGPYVLTAHATERVKE